MFTLTERRRRQALYYFSDSFNPSSIAVFSRVSTRESGIEDDMALSGREDCNRQCKWAVHFLTKGFRRLVDVTD